MLVTPRERLFVEGGGPVVGEVEHDCLYQLELGSVMKPILCRPAAWAAAMACATRS
jgi:hypothetical protein